MHQLKAQLRELDTAAALAAEEKELELRELRAECVELRELCTLKDADLVHMRNELFSLSQVVEMKEKAAEEQNERVNKEVQFNDGKEDLMRKLMQEKEGELQQV